ncbi:MAG: hypothetical protein QM594_04950 [Niabella sp.]
MKQLIYILLFIGLFTACKKGGDGPGGSKGKRVKSMNDGSSPYVFEYDAQGRLSRLYQGASASLKFSYTPAGINVQRFTSGDVPDPDSKRDYNIINGRIVNGKVYDPDKRWRSYGYGYDAQGRLDAVSVTFYYENNTMYNRTQYAFSYDAANNLEQVRRVRKEADGTPRDSIVINKGYYDKPFITWRDMGLDFFGTAAVGQEHLGDGIVVPFETGKAIYPSDHALRTESRSRYSWNALTQKWVFSSSSGGGTIPESEYQYDDKGRLINYGGTEIAWQ